MRRRCAHSNSLRGLTVHAPEAAFDPSAFLAALAERGLTVSERELPAGGDRGSSAAP